ncbi:hypothetical protein BDZ94DRAFT_1135828, partial [Collybia nuda]
TYCLRGIIYYGDNHFTARYITSGGQIWFHDGMITGQSMRYEGMLNSQLDLYTCQSKTAVSALYS